MKKIIPLVLLLLWTHLAEAQRLSPQGGTITGIVAGNGLVGGGYGGVVTLDVQCGTGLVCSEDQIALSSGAFVAGTGTLNFVPLWTPNGFTLGNSIISQDAFGTLVNVAGDLVVTGAITDTGNRVFSIAGSGLTSTGATVRLADAAALSVLGRDTSASGVPAAIVAGTDGHVLRRSGTTLGFGTIPQSSVDNLVTDLSGKASALHTHVKADITDFAHLHVISDVTGLQAALDGKASLVHGHAIADVTGLQTALDGKVPTTRTISTTAPLTGGGDLSADRTFAISNGGITNALFRSSGGLSVVGRSVNSTGTVADITATNDGDVLRRSGTTLGFGSIPQSSVTGLTTDLGNRPTGSGTLNYLTMWTGPNTVGNSPLLWDGVGAIYSTKRLVVENSSAPFWALGDSSVGYNRALYYSQDTAAAYPRTWSWGARADIWSLADETAGSIRLYIDSNGHLFGNGNADFKGNLALGAPGAGYLILRDYDTGTEDGATVGSRLISRDYALQVFNGGLVAGQYSDGGTPAVCGVTGALCATGHVRLNLNSGTTETGFLTANGRINIKQAAGSQTILAWQQAGQAEWQVYQAASSDHLRFWNSVLGFDACYITTAGVLDCYGGININGASAVTGTMTPGRSVRATAVNAIGNGAFNDDGTNVSLDGTLVVNNTNGVYLQGPGVGTGRVYNDGWLHILGETTVGGNVAISGSEIHFRHVTDGSTVVRIGGGATTLNTTLTVYDAASVLSTVTGQTVVAAGFTSGGAHNLSLYDTTASAAGVGGSIVLWGNHTGTTPTQFAMIRAMKANGTAGNIEADLVFGIRQNPSGDVAEGCRLVGATKKLNCVGGFSHNGVDLITNAVPTTRTISTTAPLAGGGDLSANRTLSINTNGITDALLRQSAGLSVIGRSANTTGNVADIIAAADGDVLRRSGTTLGFGAIPQSSVTSLVTDLAAKVPTSRTISTTGGIQGGGDLSANRTLSLTNTGVTAGSYTLASITVDAQGRITAASNGSAGGTISGSGTLRQIPMFTPNGTTLGDSLISQNAVGSEVTIAAALNTGSSQITSGRLVSTVGVGLAHQLTGAVHVRPPDNPSGASVTLDNPFFNHSWMIANDAVTGNFYVMDVEALKMAIAFKRNASGTDPYVGIGFNTISSITQRLHVNGNIRAEGSILTTGAATFGGNTSVTGNVSATGNVTTATGYVQAGGGFRYSASNSGRIWIARQVLQSTTASTSYTLNSATHAVHVRMVGGGGGGGGVAGTAGQAAGAAGGAAGAYLEKWIEGPTLVAGTYNAGTQGSGASSGASSGGAGGSSSFTITVNGTAITLTAPGGGGGAGMASGTTIGAAVPGFGSAPSISSGFLDISYKGAAGDNGLRYSASAATGGAGASSPFGSGGNPTFGGGGQLGGGYGAGGSGASTASATAFGGGFGTQGVIIIDEYI